MCFFGEKKRKKLQNATASCYLVCILSSTIKKMVLQISHKCHILDLMIWAN